jgi:uncharacterized protein
LKWGIGGRIEPATATAGSHDAALIDFFAICAHFRRSMLTLDLVQLDRHGSVDFEGVLDGADPIWSELEGSSAEGLQVHGRAQITPTGQVVVRATMMGGVDQACRRCLRSVRTELNEALDLVWAPEGSIEGDEDGELKTLDPGVRELHLLPALREECLLRVPAWVLCSEECRGLCPRCGADLNDQPCDCSRAELDPRWDVLRKLTTEERK